MSLVVRVYFTVGSPIKLHTWSGRLVSRVVGELLGHVGISIPHDSPGKPYTVSPVMDANGRVVDRLVPGVGYWFRASFFCREVDCGLVSSAFSRPVVPLSGGGVLHVVRVRFGRLEPRLGNDNGDTPTLVHWRVRYMPTAYRFASTVVTWPSPARFLASAGKSLARVLGGDSVGGVGIGDLVRELAFHTEVVRARVRRVVVRLGRGRNIHAFTGVVDYLTVTKKPSLLGLLLSTANAFGVGWDRSIGLGHVAAGVLDMKSVQPVGLGVEETTSGG